MRVHELAKELGMTNTEMMELADRMGVGVKSHSSTLPDEVAQGVRDKLRSTRAGSGLITAPPQTPRPPASAASAPASASTATPPMAAAASAVKTQPTP